MIDFLISLISFVFLVGFWVGIYRKFVKPRFPRLRPVFFGIGATVATVGFIAGLLTIFTSGPMECVQYEAAIGIQTNPNPLARKMQDRGTDAEEAAKLQRWCKHYYENCQPRTEETANWLTRACTPDR